MTAFRDLLNDEELAAVLTFVRNSWGNQASPIAPASVANLRAHKRPVNCLVPRGTRSATSVGSRVDGRNRPATRS